MERGLEFPLHIFVFESFHELTRVQVLFAIEKIIICTH